ncbi:MAG: CDP-alcohol phosphatidyltransferase family protein [Bacteroidales bacterium]|nr:CDP-alcohol phosphatidyltransferase family protein [Bacteroidales bacterium]
MKEMLQKFIYWLIQPLVKVLITLKITPNIITTIGFLITLMATIVMIYGADYRPHNDLTPLAWGGGLILFAGFFDILDGRLAREGKMASRFGALFDSVLDRYSELVMFFGICYFLVSRNYFLGSIIAFIALIGSMMVSYVRARSEGLGIECKAGLMQRPERVVIISVSALICGIVSACFGGNQRLFISCFPIAIVETISIFIYPLVFVAIFSNITAIGRLISGKKEIEKQN